VGLVVRDGRRDPGPRALLGGVAAEIDTDPAFSPAFCGLCVHQRVDFSSHRAGL